MAFDNKESLKILKEKSEFVNWKKKDNAMTKREKEQKKTNKETK